MLKKEAQKRFSERLVAAAQAYHGKEDKGGIATLIHHDFGVSIQTAAKWVRAATTPRVERWPEIAQKYRVPVAWLAGSDATVPEVIANSSVLDHSHVEAVGEAARIALPIVSKFLPDATPEQLTDVLKEAYRMVYAGTDERAIRGHIAGIVVEMEGQEPGGE